MKSTDGLLVPPHPNSQSSTLVVCTGVIGQTPHIKKIAYAIKGLEGGGGFGDWEKLTKAFTMIDMFPKPRARTFKIQDREHAIAGIDKGPGMIRPKTRPSSPSPSSTSGLHATLLERTVTDTRVSPSSLQTPLDYTVDRSFNSTSVDETFQPTTPLWSSRMGSLNLARR